MLYRPSNKELFDKFKAMSSRLEILQNLIQNIIAVIQNDTEVSIEGTNTVSSESIKVDLEYIAANKAVYKKALTEHILEFNKLQSELIAYIKDESKLIQTDATSLY